MNQQALFTIDTPILDTRARAHEKVKPTKRQLHLSLVRSLYGGTWSADTWASHHSMNFMQVRPRFSEMNKAGMLHKVGEGKSVFGNPQDIFDLKLAVRNRMDTLMANGIAFDKAAEQMIDQYLKK